MPTEYPVYENVYKKVVAKPKKIFIPKGKFLGHHSGLGILLFHRILFAEPSTSPMFPVFVW